jgi:CheY-like chemotaxis protein
MDTTILVVDDSKFQVHLMNKLLTELGYTRIQAAANVVEARKVLEEKTIDLILSDWYMPGESGLDFLRWVRATPRHSAIPFVMVSTEHEKSNIFEAARAGLQTYIFKPVSKDTLKKKLYHLVQSYPSISPPHEAL